MIPYSVPFLQPLNDKPKGNYNLSSVFTLLRVFVVHTDERASVEKAFIHIALILDPGTLWGITTYLEYQCNHCPPPSAECKDGKGIIRVQKKINSGHLPACRPQAKADWALKRRQKGSPGFHCTAPIMWLMDLSFWISVFYSCT